MSTRSRDRVVDNHNPSKEDTMSTIDMSTETQVQLPETSAVDLKLEVVVVPVADVDRAKQFYVSLGWREDVDIDGPQGYRAVHFTPTGSTASILIGNKGVTSAEPGSVAGLLLAVDDIDAARAELISRGVAVGEVFHDVGGSLGGGFIAATEARAPGHDPERRSYATYASFSDPDGNRWLLQELTERLPGRV
jgi:catechol 2,3-dioxygenase-like lactoylglutathione lyase family enzyme